WSTCPRGASPNPKRSRAPYSFSLATTPRSLTPRRSSSTEAFTAPTSRRCSRNEHRPRLDASPSNRRNYSVVRYGAGDEVLAEVLLSFVTENRYDGGRLGKFVAQSACGDHVGAGTWSHEQSVLTSEPVHLSHRVVAVHRHHSIDERLMALIDRGDETVGNAFDLVQFRVAALNRARLARLEGDDEDLGVHFAKRL